MLPFASLGHVAASVALATTASTIGAPGIGDPYYPDYGNGGYDVAHYAVDVSYAPATDRLSGTTTITARATQALTRFDLDFVLPVSAVSVNGVAATFSRTTHELVVTPHTELRQGAPMTVKVTYAGVPSSVSDGAIHPWVHNAEETLAVGEPEISAWWFPANDHPSDKATYDVTVTVPSSWQVVGNGHLMARTVSGANGTWHWREDQPMASYLAFMAIGHYTFSTSYVGRATDIIAWPTGTGATGAEAAGLLRQTPQVLSYESGLWGPYPFDAMGGLATRTAFGFSLENQTRPVYQWRSWNSGSIYNLVHELAHQWYGDSTSLERWGDIWLNEGFATYTTWLWSAQHGQGSLSSLFAHAYTIHPAGTAYWHLLVGNPGAGHEFDPPIYSRGAMTLEALWVKVGTSAFFKIMRTWAAEHRDGNGSLAQFESLAVAISHRHVRPMLDAWLMTPSRPAPTVANGFPRGFSSTTSGSRVAPPPSWAAIEQADR